MSRRSDIHIERIKPLETDQFETAKGQVVKTLLHGGIFTGWVPKVGIDLIPVTTGTTGIDTSLFDIEPSTVIAFSFEPFIRYTYTTSRSGKVTRHLLRDGESLCIVRPGAIAHIFSLELNQVFPECQIANASKVVQKLLPLSIIRSFGFEIRRKMYNPFSSRTSEGDIFITQCLKEIIDNNNLLLVNPSEGISAISNYCDFHGKSESEKAIYLAHSYSIAARAYFKKDRDISQTLYATAQAMFCDLFDSAPSLLLKRHYFAQKYILALYFCDEHLKRNLDELSSAWEVLEDLPERICKGSKNPKITPVPKVV